MQEKSRIKKNILKYIDFKGVSKYEFYKRTGITRGVLDQNNGMSEENTTKFLAVYGNELPAEYLFKELKNVDFVQDSSLKLQENSSAYLTNQEDLKLILKEKEERILYMKETIDAQKKYIVRLEEDIEKLISQVKEKPAEQGQV